MRRAALLEQITLNERRMESSASGVNSPADTTAAIWSAHCGIASTSASTRKPACEWNLRWSSVHSESEPFGAASSMLLVGLRPIRVRQPAKSEVCASSSVKIGTSWLNGSAMKKTTLLCLFDR